MPPAEVKNEMPAPAPDAPAYPYGSAPLVPVWQNRTSQCLGALAILSAVAALYLASPFSLSMIDEYVLRILFPAGLAFVLAFTPEAVTRVGRIAKVLTVIGLCAALFSGPYTVAMLGAYPLVLLTAVAFGRNERRNA
jgi:hypothetical protein